MFVLCLKLTYDAADIVPDGDVIRSGLGPVVGRREVERQPEEEGIVDKLETRVRQRILEANTNTAEVDSRINTHRYV